MFNFFNNLGKRKLIALAVFAVFLITLPIVLVQVQNQQQIRQRAASSTFPYFQINPKFQNVTKVGDESSFTLNFVNPNNKNISAVDVTINYNSDVLELNGTPKEGWTLVYNNDANIPGKAHYVLISTAQTANIDGLIPLLNFSVKAKNFGLGYLDVRDDFLVTVQGESSPLNISQADNDRGTFTVGEPTPTSFPIASHPSPTSIPLISPTISSACQAPQIISCGPENANNAASWVPVDGATSYRLEWCYPDANFSDDDFKNSLCNFITTPETNVYIIFPVKPSDYKIRVRSDSSNACSTVGEWSDIMSCTTIFPTPTPTPIPTPVVNRIPPFISDIDMDPSLGQVGTKFLVFSRVTSEGILESIKATVKYDRGSIMYEEIIQLYDDGTHGDDKAGDGYYVNVWDSNKKGIPKEVAIEAKDTDENTSTLSKAFELSQDLCKEAVLGHNDKNAKRVNIVFAGANYGGIASFIKDVDQTIDVGGEYGGFLSQEPFRSNKNKFNFWYSNQIGYIKGCDMDNIVDVAQCRATIKFSAQSCVVDRKYIAGLVNSSLTSFALGRTAYIGFGFNEVYPSGIGAFMHEFGHTFGKLSDEYIGTNVPFKRILTPLIGEEGSSEGHNIFKGSREACLSIKNPWYSLIGRGCGADNVIDCIDSYNPDKDEITCIPGVDRKACENEVGCFKGAGTPDKFRSSFNTVMRLTEDDLRPFSRSYGPVNERELCKKIKKATGSVGGICSEYNL